MDRSHPQVACFAASLAGMDDDALATLANKGLVRRARKDLEKSPPQLAGANADSVSLRIEDATVRLVQPINKSTCSCASGICRHILAAVIYLRDTSVDSTAATGSEQGAQSVQAAPTPAPPSDPAAALLALDEQAIQKWAGKSLMRRATAVLSRSFEIEEAPSSIVVRLPAQNITVRCLAGGLDAMLCACHAPGACEHKVAAVLAIRAQRTGGKLELTQSAIEASAGAPRTREEVRQSVLELLCEVVTLGLSRLSPTAESRLRTLATSAHGVDLPRLSRMVKSLADEVGMMLKRDASASAPALLSSCSRVAALCDALEAPTPGLVGEHRSVYLPVAGSIEVAGLGAKRWRTRSGYHGLTVLFWEPAARRWTAWNDARPIGTPGFDPLQRFSEAGPWNGSATPRQAAQTFWRLTGVHRNAAGRITVRDNSRGIATRPVQPRDGPLITDFSQIAPAAQSAFLPGLAERADHADLVLLAPAQWFPAAYDPITQEVARCIVDANGLSLLLRLRHSEETAQGLTTLEKIDGASVNAVLGSLRIGPLGLFVEPITLWTDRPIHLTLDAATTASATAPAPIEPEEADDDVAAEESIPLDSDSPLGHLLALVQDELVSIAESGIGVVRDLSPLRAAARELSAVGLASVSPALRGLCDELDRYRNSVVRDPALPAQRLLQSAYIVQLSGVCETLRAALGQ